MTSSKLLKLQKWSIAMKSWLLINMKCPHPSIAPWSEARTLPAQALPSALWYAPGMPNTQWVAPDYAEWKICRIPYLLVIRVRTFSWCDLISCGGLKLWHGGLWMWLRRVADWAALPLPLHLRWQVHCTRPSGEISVSDGALHQNACGLCSHRGSIRAQPLPHTRDYSPVFTPSKWSKSPIQPRVVVKITWRKLIFIMFKHRSLVLILA